jgi:hypothetical protein
MMKNFLLAVALLSLALASGCATGGNGIVPPQTTVTVNGPADINTSAIYPTQTLTMTATVANSSNTAVTWSLSGSNDCTGSACGTLTPVTPATNPATAVYVAPACVSQTTCLSGAQPIITATLVSDTSITGTLGIGLVDVTTEVAPSTLNVGTGLTQQFTATAVPDDAPQTFTWTCSANGNPCVSFSQDANVSGLAYYTGNDTCTGSCVTISAITPLDQAGCSDNPKYCTLAKFALVTSRLSGTYAFRFSGYDGSNNPVAVAGTFTATNGTITSGVEDELTSSGPNTQIAISGGSYTPTSSDRNNSNNAGTLILTLPGGVYPNQFQAVLDGAGDIQMIENDGHGRGSGVAEAIYKNNGFNSGEQTFAFGFTGVNASGNRIGYAGLMPINGAGVVSGGSIDVNDNGNAKNSICNAPPCTVTGTYQQLASGAWQLALTAPIAMNFDFYVANGNTKASTPQTLYAISTDSNPAVSGTMVLQDSTQTYNINAFDGVSVSALTGLNGGNTNVSLTLGTTDGSGDFSGQYDQNNAGVISSAIQFPVSSTAYTYTASSTNNGRYIFPMLGNPGASPVVPPVPFILYASGANRGFLLDQSSPSVMTGTMNPQGKGGTFYDPSELTGTYAVATTTSANSAASLNASSLIAANLLLTSTGNSTYNVAGTLYPGAQPVPSGSSYTLTDGGPGTIVLNDSPTQNYAIYTVDTSGCFPPPSTSPVCSILDFYMIDEDKTNLTPAVIFAHQ